MCLRQASIGAHCFECVHEAAPSRRDVARERSALGQRAPWVTLTFIAANVAIFLGTRNGTQSIRNSAVRDWATQGIAIDRLGEWWRVVSGGFLHFDLRHVGFNMILLFLLGRRLEQVIGPLRFGGVYTVSLLGGSAGALVLSPNAFTAGASGAVYGLMGAVFVAERASGRDPWNDGIGTLIMLNIVFSFLIPNISIGGHLGGLVAGALAGASLGDQRRPKATADHVRTALLLVLVGVVAVGAALYGASTAA